SLDGRSQVPEPAAAGGAAAGTVLAPHAAARPRVYLGQFHSQAWRDWRSLFGGAGAALRLLSARPAGRGRLDADHPRRRAGHAMVHCRARWPTSAWAATAFGGYTPYQGHIRNTLSRSKILKLPCYPIFLLMEAQPPRRGRTCFRVRRHERRASDIAFASRSRKGSARPIARPHL